MLRQVMRRLTGLYRLPAHLAVVGGSASQSARQVTAAMALGIALGLIVLVAGPMLALATVAGLILLAVTFTHPEVVILLVLCFATGLVPASLNPHVSLLVGHFQISDLLLLWLLFVVAFRVFTDKSFRYVKTPLDLPLLLFYGAVLAGLATAVLRFGVDFSDATYEARMLMYYLVFFAVTNLVRTRAQLVWLAHGVLAVGLLAAVMMIAQVALGRSTALMASWMLQGGDLVRVYFPGFTSVYVVLITLVSCMALCDHERRTVLRWLQVLVLAVALLTTLARNLLVSLAAAGALLVAILSEPARSRFGRNLLGIAFVAIGLVAVLTLAGRASALVAYSGAFVERLGRMVSGQIVAPGENLVPRWAEVRFAWAQISNHPILGIGLKSPYRPPFYMGEPVGARTFIHNAYLSLWLKTGLPGLVSFLWLSGMFLWRGFRHWRDTDDVFLRSVALGFTLAYFGMMLSNWVTCSLVQEGSLPIFGVVLGINEVIFRQNGSSEGNKEGGATRGRQKTAASA